MATRHPLHDYSGGGYFITFNIQDRIPVLGAIEGRSFALSRNGAVVIEAWQELPKRFPGVVTDCIQLMPDHVHCIIIISSVTESGEQVKEIARLGKVMNWFKGWSARQINLRLALTGKRFWQPGYNDRVIRNERELLMFRRYIINNPASYSLAHGSSGA